MDLQNSKHKWQFNKIAEITKHWRINKIWQRVGLVVIAVMVLSVAGWLVYDRLTAPVKITKVQFERSLSSRTNDAPVKKEFAVNEPIMMMFEYASAQPETSARLEIYRGKDKIRNIDLPYLRGDKTAPDNGKRYISIVNGASTKLEAGDYTTRIIVNNKRTVLSEKLVVK